MFEINEDERELGNIVVVKLLNGTFGFKYHCYSQHMTQIFLNAYPIYTVSQQGVRYIQFKKQ